MQLADFIKAQLGQRVQAPGGLGGQCVDLANLYLQLVRRVPLVRENAVDWRSAVINGFIWVDNEPLNYPSFGDLVVWGQDARVATGPDGHIAIAILASSNRLLSCDQNWPDRAPVSLTWHNYDGVLGWQSVRTT